MFILENSKIETFDHSFEYLISHLDIYVNIGIFTSIYWYNGVYVALVVHW
jgi:hypothetical protein